MLIHSPEERSFIGADGQLHWIIPLAPSPLERLKSLLSELYEAIGRHGYDKSFAEIYDADFQVAVLSQEIIKLHNLKPEWLSIGHYFTFLMPHQLDDGTEMPIGVLPAINGLSAKLPEEGPGSGRSFTEAERKASYYKFMASLFVMTNDLRATLEAFEQVPIDVLTGLMSEIADIKDPEAKKKKLQQEVKRQMQEELKKANHG